MHLNFIEKAVCVHSLGFTNINELGWFGLKFEINDKKFYPKIKWAKKGVRSTNELKEYIK